MSSFFGRSRRNQAPEVREATEAEASVRAARLQALDDEIGRRAGELHEAEDRPAEESADRPTEEFAVPGFPDAESPSPPLETTENGARAQVNEQLAGIEQVLRETVSALAQRVDAVETGLLETRQAAEANLAQPAPPNEALEARLAKLEASAGRLDDLEASERRLVALEAFEQRLAGLEAAAAEAASAKERLIPLAGRVEALEASLKETRGKSVEREPLEQRLVGLEAATAEATKANDHLAQLAGQVQALDASLRKMRRARVDPKALEQRLVGLEAAAGDAVIGIEALGARFEETLERLSQRVESIDARLVVAEQRASSSDERLRAMAESILERPGQPIDPSA